MELMMCQLQTLDEASILMHGSDSILTNANHCLWPWHISVSGCNHLLHYMSSQCQREAAEKRMSQEEG